MADYQWRYEVECPECSEMTKVKISSSPTNMLHKHQDGQLRTHYVHCQHCGATLTLRIELGVARKRFVQEDLFTSV